MNEAQLEMEEADYGKSTMESDSLQINKIIQKRDYEYFSNLQLPGSIHFSLF